MTSHNEIPLVSVEQHPVSREFVLNVSSFGKTEPAGERLFRGKPYPDVSFRHADEKQAKLDAAILQAYIDRTHVKRMSKQKIREGGEG